MGHLEPSAAAAGLASLVLVPLGMRVVALNAQLRLSVRRLCERIPERRTHKVEHPPVLDRVVVI